MTRKVVLKKLDIRDGKPDDPLRRRLKIYSKYFGKLSWRASNTRPYLVVYVMNLVRR